MVELNGYFSNHIKGAVVLPCSGHTPLVKVIAQSN